MAVGVQRRTPAPPMGTIPEAGSGRGLRLPRDARWWPILFTALNGVLFLIFRPNVNDLWAARARANAARNGVGLTYWFSWFGGGSTPGNYSIVTPYLSAYLSAELVCVLSAVALVIASTIAVRGTRHPLAACWIAAAATLMNLWSGRVPYLLGMAIAVTAFVLMMRNRTVLAAVLAILTVASSPVAGAFFLVALGGLWFARPDRARAILVVGVITVLATGGIGVLFGTPGPQPFSNVLLVALLIATILFLSSGQPTPVRYTLYLMVPVVLALYYVHNGMGSNISRLYWFCLPVVAVALSRRRTWVVVALVTPMLIYGVSATLVDLHNAARPTAGKSYYQPLIKKLDSLPELSTYRLEVVAQNEHAAYDALLDHAMLARGWETQEDRALNAPVLNKALDAVTYRVWLENNAVGYVALPTIPQQTYPEYNLVAVVQPSYLKSIWHNPDWTLFRVENPTPVVAKPATLLEHGQARLEIRVPCECKINIRIRYSRYLKAVNSTTSGTAKLTDDGFGWTNMTTTVRGTYVLTGSLTRAFG